MSDKLIGYLEKLDLSQNEAEIYFTLLRLGSGVVGTISKESEIARTTTYQVLDRLIEIGLVFKIDKNNVLTYFPEEPERLVNILEKKVKDLDKKIDLAEKLIPHLENIKNPYKSKPKVSYSEGINGYKNLLLKAIEKGETEIRMMTNSRYKSDSSKNIKLAEIFDFEQKEFCQARVKNKIKLKLISTNPEIIENLKLSDKENLRESKLLPKEFGDIETMVITRDDMIIITDNHPLIGVNIEEEQIITMMRNFFDFVWDKSM